MKQNTHTLKSDLSAVPWYRSFRRLVRQIFSSALKRQIPNDDDAFPNDVMRKLEDIEEMLEIMAREMARQPRRGK